MKTSRFLLPAFLALLPAFSPFAAAQNAPETLDGDFGAPADNGANNPGANPNFVDGASRVTQVNAANLANLSGVLGRPGLGAVSLGASEAEFAANAGARAALLAWVRGGGTVFLHTGAARAFGFETVEARPGTNVLAGQLYGRARAALPFGAHPLLWDDGRSVPQRRAPGADPTRFPGVDTVFYQLREGDHLVVSHPAGTPLLTVRDLAGGVGTGTLFAAALAPFGRGFAIFTPDAIDQNRGDGALFARNLLHLLAPATGARPNANNLNAANARLVGVSASVIENGAAAPDALQRALRAAGAQPRGSAPLPAFGTNPQAAAVGANNGVFNDGAVNNGAANNGVFNNGAVNTAPPLPGVPQVGAPDPLENAPVLPNGPLDGNNQNDDGNAAPSTAAIVLLSRAEANSYARLLAAGGDRAGAAINLLRARLFLGRGDVLNAGRALEASEELAPDSAELALWRGILQVGAAQNVSQPSPVRAELVTNAARDFAQAAGGASILGAANGANRNGINDGAASGGAALAGIPRVALRSWSTKLAQIGQVFALEPPLVQTYGVGTGAITVRAIAGDSSLLLLVPNVQILANARNFGWHGDNEEILLFPNARTYLSYRRALGLTGPTVPLAPGAVGDVVGQRMSLIGFPGFPIAAQNPTIGQGLSLANNNSGPVGTLARLHSYVLLGAYDEGARSPAWLQLGLENLLNAAITGDNRAAFSPQTLEANAQTGGLLTPPQFANLAGALPAQIFLAQSQSSALMSFFYRAYGAGAVTETVQRLGAGQSIDEALLATTQGDETAFFRFWREAQFGPRNFPNRG